MANRDRFVDSGSNPSTGGTVGRIRQHAAHGALCRHGNGCGMGYRRLPSFVPFFSFWHICKFLVAVGVVVARNDPVGMVELARADVDQCPGIQLVYDSLMRSHGTRFWVFLHVPLKRRIKKFLLHL